MIKDSTPRFGDDDDTAETFAQLRGDRTGRDVTAAAGRGVTMMRTPLRYPPGARRGLRVRTRRNMRGQERAMRDITGEPPPLGQRGRVLGAPLKVLQSGAERA